jgi:hypothetical protein
MMTVLALLALGWMGYCVVWKNYEQNQHADSDDPLSWSPRGRLK